MNAREIVVSLKKQSEKELTENDLCFIDFLFDAILPDAELPEEQGRLLESILHNLYIDTNIMAFAHVHDAHMRMVQVASWVNGFYAASKK